MATRKNVISTKELEHWLAQVFVPVEPSEVFVRRLKTRLLKYHGDRVFSIWMLIGVIAMLIVLMLTWLGFLLRIILLLAGLFAGKRQRAQRKSQWSPASG